MKSFSHTLRTKSLGLFLTSGKWIKGIRTQLFKTQALFNHRASVCAPLKRQFKQKWQFLHHLLTLMSLFVKYNLKIYVIIHWWSCLAPVLSYVLYASQRLLCAFCFWLYIHSLCILWMQQEIVSEQFGHFVT